MIRQQIKNFIKPIRRKMLLERILDRCLLTMLWATMVGVLLAIVSHITVIVYVERWLIAGVGAGALAGIIWGFIRYPRIMDTLKVTDSLGYDERLMTAWQLMDDDSIEAILQREDTQSAMTGENHRKSHKITFKPRKLLYSLLLLAISIGILFIDSSVRETAKEREEMFAEIISEEEALKELAEELLEEEEAPDALKERMKELLEDLDEKLKEAKTEEEALKALSIAKDEVRKLDMDEQEAKLAELQKQLAESEQKPGDAQSQEALKDKMDALEKALEKLKEQGLDPEEIEPLEELEEAMKALQEAMEAGDMEAMSEAMAELSELSEVAMEALQNAGELSEGMQAAINEAGKALSTNPTVSEMAFAAASENSDPSASMAGEGAQLDGTPSEGSGESPAGAGQGQGQGQGQGSGQGAGQGQGTGQGQGQGSGSTNEDQGYQDGESSGGGGWFEGEAKSEDYEALYPGTHLGGESDPTFVQGNRGEGGDSEIREVEGADALAGDLVSYRELYAEYSADAMHSVEDMEIPVLMKDLVKAYFSSLE